MKYISIFILLLLTLSSGYAVEEITEDDKEKFDNILTPINKIYNLVKYVATSIATLMLLFSGIVFMTSGNDKNKRESAKDMGTYVVIGLIVIWAAPILVSYLVE
jgi:uncharacterized membrane protein